MKILVIDNGTSYLPQLKNLLSGHDICVINYSEISATDINSFNLIILSGGHKFSVKGSDEQLNQEMELVKNSSKPIFGICFGFEVIAYTFGAKLKLMESKELGVIDIRVVESDKIFSNISNFQVFESHRWIIEESVSDLTVLARSKDGIEAIKHKNRPIYGVQFHPEMFVEKTCGDELFSNFLKTI
mgnify:CR=1 FL=1